MHLEHVNVTVADVERSSAFYADLLDLHIRWKGESADGKRVIHVGDNRSYLALFEARKAGQPVQDYDAVGINHYGFVVDDLDAALARLRTLGYEPHGEFDYEPGRRAYFFDPDGLEVELVQY